MPTCIVDRISTSDVRYPLPPGAGSDAVHTNPEYCFAVTRLHADSGLSATGIALTLGDGNRLVCEAIELLAEPLVGLPIEELMADFGNISKRLADDPALRWLGPHKGVVHLALASITNACFDLWAKSRRLPLWKLLLELTPEQVVQLLDLRSYRSKRRSIYSAIIGAVVTIGRRSSTVDIPATILQSAGWHTTIRRSVSLRRVRLIRDSPHSSLRSVPPTNIAIFAELRCFANVPVRRQASCLMRTSSGISPSPFACVGNWLL